MKARWAGLSGSIGRSLICPEAVDTATCDQEARLPGSERVHLGSGSGLRSVAERDDRAQTLAEHV